MFLGFIFYKAIGAISDFGFSNFFLNWASGSSAPKVSIYAPLVYTLILVVLAVWITNKIALKIAKSLLKVKESYRRVFCFSLKWISILPSFITSFILFEAIIPVLTKIFGSLSSFSLIWVFICFFTILFPTSCLTYLDWFNSREIKTMNSALLGLALDDKYREKIYLKCSKKTIYLNWATSLIKALGESVALSWFLSSDKYDKPFSSLSNFLSAESHTISSLISSFYFSEGGGEKNRQAMYVFGSSLLILSIFLNWFFRRKAAEINYRGNPISRKLESYSWRFKSRIEKFRYPNRFVYLSRYLQEDIYSKKAIAWKQFLRTFRGWREKTLVFLVLSLFLTILGVAIFRGLYFIFYNLSTGNTESYSIKGLVVPTWNSLLLLFFSVSWSFPICFFSAFFVHIYLRKNRRIKSFFTSIISGIGTAPPMLWAMFSSFFFLNYLKLGIGKTSVFAGILSFTILSFPFLFNKFSNLLEAYSKKYSKALSYLGLQNFNLIYLLLRDGKTKIRKHLSNLTTKLNGESGLLFITMGVSPSSRFTLWGPGQTLTTKFFASFYNYKIVEVKSAAYETIFFILLFSVFVYSLLTTFWVKLFRKITSGSRKFVQKRIFNYYRNIDSECKTKFLVQLRAQ